MFFVLHWKISIFCVGNLVICITTALGTTVQCTRGGRSKLLAKFEILTLSNEHEKKYTGFTVDLK